MNLTQTNQIVSRRAFLRGSLAAGAAVALSRWAAGLDLVWPESRWDVPGVAIYPRSSWSAAAPRLAQLTPATTYTRLTVHHAGGPVNTHVRWAAVADDLNGVLEGHLQRHYGDIAYHFIVDYAGRIWEGRSLAYEGAHVSGQNIENLGVMLLGNFEEQAPAVTQVGALFQLVEALRRKHPIAADCIYGHCDLGWSACPGHYLYQPFVGRLRAMGGGLDFGSTAAAGRQRQARGDSA